MSIDPFRLAVALSEITKKTGRETVLRRFAQAVSDVAPEQRPEVLTRLAQLRITKHSTPVQILQQSAAEILIGMSTSHQ